MATPTPISVLNVALPNLADSGSITITIPTGANACHIGGLYYVSDSSVITSITGSAFAATTNGALRVNNPSSGAYMGTYSIALKISATGTQNIRVQKTGAYSEGPTCQIRFYTVDDPDNFVPTGGHVVVQQTASPQALAATVNSNTGDLVAGFFGTDGSSADPSAPTGTTLQGTMQTTQFDKQIAFAVTTPGASTTTVTAGSRDFPGMSLLALRGSGGGSTPKTLATSLAVAVQLARTAAASVGVAVQAPSQAATSVALAISAVRSATTSLDAALQQAKAASALVQVAVQAPQTVGTSVSNAIQLARAASADLALVIQQAQTLGFGVDLQVQAPSQVSTSVSMQIQAGATLSAAVQIAVQALRQATASLAVAISQDQAAAASVSAGVQIGRTSSTSAAMAIQAGRTAAVGVDMQVQEGSTRALALQAAVQFAVNASTAIAAAVAQLRTASVGLSAAISLQRTLGFAIDVAVWGSRTSECGVSLFVDDPTVVIEIDPRFIAKPTPRNWVAKNTPRNWEART